MIKKELQAKINDQINFEYESALLYKQMSIQMDTIGWAGFAQWFHTQYHEEIAHAEDMVRYMLSRGETPVLKDIKIQKPKTADVIAYFEAAYKHECTVSDRIDDIVTEAITAKDYATENFFRKYVDEQVEEEETVAGIVDRLKLANGTAGFVVIDSQLGNRK